MDASQHLWFNNEVTHLHAAIDDATGKITGAYFDHRETLKGYYHVFHQTLTNYGIPHEFLTDRRTIFYSPKEKASPTKEDASTQFAYACSCLGVSIDFTSIPQAKGRIERLFQTLQSRLPIELRIRNITTIDKANEFLKSYLKEFNQQFALHSNTIKSVLKKQPSDVEINLLLSTNWIRTVDHGHSV